MWNELIDALAPWVLEAAIGLIIFVLTWIAGEIHRKTGFMIQLGTREMLDQALRRILVGMVERDLTKDAIINIALAYLKATMPAALRRLGVSDDALRERISAEIAKIELGK